jgi:hypothetical protein
MMKTVANGVVRATLLASLPAAILGASSLNRTEIAEAIAFGQRCTAPIVRIPAQRGQDFDVYVESALGRAALVVATATVMHVSIEAPAVTHALQESHARVWGVYANGARPDVSVRRITIRATGGPVISPVSQQYERFFVGTVPSHGIIEPLRARFGEAVFDKLPAGDFDVLFETTAGTQRYHVTDQARSIPLRVCN